MKVTTLGRLSWFYNRKASSNNFFVKKTIVEDTDLFVWVRFNNFYGRSEICYRVFLFCIALLDFKINRTSLNLDMSKKKKLLTFYYGVLVEHK